MENSKNNYKQEELIDIRNIKELEKIKEALGFDLSLKDFEEYFNSMKKEVENWEKIGIKPDKIGEKMKVIIDNIIFNTLYPTIMKRIKDPNYDITEELEHKLEGLKREIKDIGLYNQIRSNNLVKVALHLENQKFGKKTQLELFENIKKEDTNLSKEIRGYEIKTIGINNTQAQNNALFAIQKLLTKTNYKGNSGIETITTESNDVINIPMLKITISKYLEAYGLRKRMTKRGYKEYRSNERDEALKALRDLHNNRYLLIYERKYWIQNKKGQPEERYDLIRKVAPLINIVEGYKELTKSERDIVIKGEDDTETNDKLKYLVLEPSPLLVDQIDTYFILKPANYREEIKAISGSTKKSSKVYDFIDFLITQTELKRRTNDELVIKIDYETLVYKLRLENYMKNRMHKRIKESITHFLKIAKELGYITDYEIVKKDRRDKFGQYNIKLNEEKYIMIEQERKNEQK